MAKNNGTQIQLLCLMVLASFFANGKRVSQHLAMEQDEVKEAAESRGVDEADQPVTSTGGGQAVKRASIGDGSSAGLQCPSQCMKTWGFLPDHIYHLASPSTDGEGVEVVSESSPSTGIHAVPVSKKKSWAGESKEHKDAFNFIIQTVRQFQSETQPYTATWAMMNGDLQRKLIALADKDLTKYQELWKWVCCVLEKALDFFTHGKKSDDVGGITHSIGKITSFDYDPATVPGWNDDVKDQYVRYLGWQLTYYYYTHSFP